MKQTSPSPLTPIRSDGTNRWFDLRQLDVEGRGWNDTKDFYDRLPAKAERVVRQPVWDLSRNSAGLCARFVTDATSLQARWALTNPCLHLPNMTAIGKSGLDLYVKMKNGWRWLAVGQPTAQTKRSGPCGKSHSGQARIPSLPAALQRHEICRTRNSRQRRHRKSRLVGTGRPQTHCFLRHFHFAGPQRLAPRHGTQRDSGTAIQLADHQSRFFRQWKLEPEMADLLAELDPSVYVLDCLPNIVADEIKERVEPCVRKLRAAHPDTPIVLVEDRTLQDSFLIAGRMKWYHLKDRAALKAAYQALKKSGVKNLCYIPGEPLLGDDGEGSVDGSHPTDLGFMRQAEIFAGCCVRC